MSQPWRVDAREHTTSSESDSRSPRPALPSPPFKDADWSDAPGRIPQWGPNAKFRHERERAHSATSPRDLLQMLIKEEYKSKQMRKILYTAFDQLRHETKRANAAESRIEEMIQRARALNEARTTAQQQAVRAQDELRLYKLQLDNAQQEILRAQDVLNAIQAQRDEAEAAATSARSKARRLNEEHLMALARDEGRRLGFEEGVRRGRRMGHNEAGVNDRRDGMREVATAAADRLLEARNEPEQIELPEETTPIPPPSNGQMPVHRSMLPRREPFSYNIAHYLNSVESLDYPTRLSPHSTSRTTTSTTSRPRSVPQPWIGAALTEPPLSDPPQRRRTEPNTGARIFTGRVGIEFLEGTWL